jgi:enterochelin esterase-like enzyme
VISPFPTSDPSTPDISLTPSPDACLSAPGQVLNGVADSSLLAKPMTYRVYLPPCYFEDSSTRYPTLYLLHGQTYNEDQWLRLGAASLMDQLISIGEIRPFIIVFPYDYSYLQPTQYPFEDVFMNVLVPQIDARYRTIPAATDRAVGGLSRGGAWALHLGIRHPDVFGAIGAHSPAIFYSDGSSLKLTLLDLPQEQLPRLFMDIGDSDDELPNMLTFKNFLDEHEIPYEWHSYVGFHEEKYWAAHLEGYLRWYVEGWAQK